MESPIPWWCASSQGAHSVAPHVHTPSCADPQELTPLSSVVPEVSLFPIASGRRNCDKLSKDCKRPLGSVSTSPGLGAGQRQSSWRAIHACEEGLSASGGLRNGTHPVAAGPATGVDASPTCSDGAPCFSIPPPALLHVQFPSAKQAPCEEVSSCQSDWGSVEAAVGG